MSQENSEPEHICSQCGNEMDWRTYDVTPEHGATVSEWFCWRCE